MRTFIHLLYLVISLFILTNCSIEQHIHFNKDFSGTVNYKIDVSTMNLLSNLDSTQEKTSWRNDSLFNFDTEMARLGQIPGISDLEFIDDSLNDIISFSYNFDNLDALNSSLANSNLTSAKDIGGTVFKKKGKTLTYVVNDIETTDTSGDVLSMMEYYKYKLILSFENEIKKVDNMDAHVSDDKHSLFIETNFADLYRKNVILGMNIKLD